ncbi:MAG: hypothetical protein V1722_00625 [Candidatus Micrarchaeota archaeon]
MVSFVDFHIHSKYSRACSPQSTLEGLAQGAQAKGLSIIGTGDFTHPLWFKEIKSKLREVESGVGLYELTSIKTSTRFMLTVEVATFDSMKRVHHVLHAPSLDVAVQLNDVFSKRGSLASDGRPMFGKTSCVELVEIVKNVSKDIEIVAAHCLLPGTPISSVSELKAIEDISEGDSVYTHLGRLRKVTKTISRDYKGIIYKVIPWYFSLGVAATGEHPIYLIKTVKQCGHSPRTICKPTPSHLKGCTTGYFQQYKPTWAPLSSVEIGDVLLYPRFNNNSQDVQILDIKLENTSFSLKIDADFCRLAGYYLAEGYCNNRDAISFTFSPTETGYMNDVKTLMQQIFNVKPMQGKSAGDLVFYSKSIMTLFQSLFYDKSGVKRAFSKCLPVFMLNLPVDKQVQILRGWWRGDKGSTSSRIFANQIKIICLRLGIVPGIRVDSALAHAIRGKHFIGKRQIVATCDNFVFNTLTFFEDKFNLLSELEFSKFNFKTNVRHGWIDDAYVYLPVRKIETRKYAGKVYNLEVDEDNSYLTEFATVHNCWTPWFGVLGDKSGYNSVQEAYEDKSGKVLGIETGMSSDPAMNWQVSSLDQFAIVSGSDPHSPHPWRIGRECNAFSDDCNSFEKIFNAIRSNDASKFLFTVETSPSYGKYHWSGHRLCNFSCSSAEAKKLKEICPRCGKQMTIGVEKRVIELADRPEGFRRKGAIPFRTVLPLAELIASVLGSNLYAVKVQEMFNKLIAKFVNEFRIVFDVPESELREVVGLEMARVIMLNRENAIKIKPGYDGEYGELLLPEQLKLGKRKKEPSLVSASQKSLGEF